MPHQLVDRGILHTRLDEEDYFYERYELGKMLGQGAFGIVYLGIRKDKRTKHAIKVVMKDKTGSSAMRLLDREVALLKLVDHEHLICLQEVLETDSKMFLIMELCEQGSLSSFVQSRNDNKLTEKETKLVVRRVASAIAYLHKYDIVHRDLKLDNILLQTNQEDPDDLLYVKVTDFGLSIMVEGPGVENMLQNACGTTVYMAPELLSKHSYSHLCDNWSLGVIMAHLLTGKLPWTGRDEDELLLSIRTNPVSTFISKPPYKSFSKITRDCLTGLLNPDPAQRLTSGELAIRLDENYDPKSAPTVPNVIEMMKLFHSQNGNDMEEDDEDDEIPDNKLQYSATTTEHVNVAGVSLHAPTEEKGPAGSSQSASSKVATSVTRNRNLPTAAPTTSHRPNTSSSSKNLKKKNTEPSIRRQGSGLAQTRSNPAAPRSNSSS